MTAPGGSASSGAITFAATGAAGVSMSSSTITIDATDTDTKTKIRVGTSASYAPADNTNSNFTFLDSGGATVSQAANGTTGDPEITISSTDTVTRVRGGSTAAFLPSSTGTANTDVTFIGGTHRDSSVSVQQNGNSIEIDAFNDDTITKIGSTASNGTFSLAAGDFRFTSSGDAELTQTTIAGVTTIDISSTNTDTGAGLGGDNGIILNAGNFELKNASSLTGNQILKWDSANAQLVNSLIADNGTTITIGGNLNVTGTTTTLESTILQVKDPIIELRKGNSLVGAEGGIQINRTSNSGGIVQTWVQLQWYETGGYFRSLDNSGVAKRFVTESEEQTLTNKTLSGAEFTGNTDIGIVTNTSINGLIINPCISSTFDIADSKTVTFNNTLTFSGTDTSTVNFANGGGAGAQVAYSSNNLGDFATTTSVQLRGTLSDGTGSGSCVFNTLPVFSTGLVTQDTGFAVFNTNATTINAFGAATSLNLGSSTSGTTTIRNSLTVNDNVEFNTNASDTFTVNGTINFVNNDIKVRGDDANPMTLGRGNGAVSTNTALGVDVLTANQSGSQNTGVGYEALGSNVSGLGNVAVGDGALSASDVGSNNVAIGKDSGLASTSGDHNVAIGCSAMYTSTAADDNICIGAFAGYNMTGSGNVLIGSGRIIDSLYGSTYQPPSSAGSVQLLIGSTTEVGGTRYSGSWIKGDIDFNVAMDNDLTVGGALTVDGDLTINGTTTTINTQNIQIDDNAIELAAVQLAQFSGNVSNGSPFVTNVEVLTGVIVGMTVNVISGTSLPAGTTTITSVDTVNGVVGLSQNIASAGGTGVFEALGPTDEAANDGGLILKGTTLDKTILYDNDRADKYWVFSENLEIKANKHIAINGSVLISGTTLGTSVVNSSLTSVGTLSGLAVVGAAAFSGRIKESNDNNFTSNLTPSSGVLTINTATSNTICGTPAAAAITEWAFTNVNLGNGETFTVTLILASNTTALYADACSVDGNSVTNGVKWSGGSPPTPTNNTDILTFIIVKDGSGNIQVFGQGNTDFS